MQRRTLGRTGLEITQLGYGSMGLRGPRTWGIRVVSDADADRILNAVLDHTTIVGTRHLPHLQENLNSAALGPLPSDLVLEIARRVSDIL